MSSGPDLEVKRCAKCAAWIPATATMCAYCNTTRPDEPLGRPRGTLLSMRHGFSVTKILIIANFVYFAFSLFVQYRANPQGNPLQWATTGTGLREGLWYTGMYEHHAVAVDHQWWRVLCATFLHIGGLHILMNMLALKQLGDLAEGIFGPAKFLAVYVVSGITCSIGISVWYAGIRHLPAEEISPVAGASGAIFGVAGLLTVYLLRAGTDRGRAVAMTIGKNVLFMLAVGLVVPGLISQVGHVGGLLPGLLFGYLISGDFGARLRPKSNWTGVAFVCAAAAAASLLVGTWYALQHLGGR